MIMKIVIPKYIEIYLSNQDSVPLTDSNFVEGIPGKLFILGSEDLASLDKVIRTLEIIPEEEWRAWDDETKWHYSAILNAADRASTHCVIVPQIPSVMWNFSETLQKQQKMENEQRQR